MKVGSSQAAAYNTSNRSHDRLIFSRTVSVYSPKEYIFFQSYSLLKRYVNSTYCPCSKKQKSATLLDTTLKVLSSEMDPAEIRLI